jgi:hypothetical protein
MTKRNKTFLSRRVRLQSAVLATLATGVWAAAPARAGIIISDNFTNGTDGNTLVGATPDTTDVPGSTYLQNGAIVFGIAYTAVTNPPYALSASVGADSGAALATGISSTVAYQVSIAYNNNTIGDTAGDLQRGDGLGFFSTVSSGYNGYHGVGNFTGIVVSPGGDVRLLVVGPQGTNEPAVTEISDYQLPSYDNTANHTLAYTANTSSGLISSVLVDGAAIPLTDTTAIFSPGSTTYVGFTASGNAGGQNALFNNFNVSATAVVGPIPPSAWTQAGSGDWNVASNWTTGVPNAIGAEADLFGAITANHNIYSDIPITVGTINFNSPFEYVIDGAGSMTLQTSSGSANLIVQQGTQKINLPLTIASNTSINVASGSTLQISDPVTINPGMAVNSIGTGTVTYQSTITLGSGASLTLASSTFAASLALPTNALTTVATSTGTRSLLQLDALSIGTGSTLDLSNNDLVVHGGNLATITALLKSGYNETVGGATWTGTGIQSSAAASNSKHLTALGVVPVTVAGTFDGAPVAVGDVLVRYTYVGDANLDGKVDGSDYSLIDAGYAAHGALSGWAHGDFNYDGVIDGSDYALIDNAFNNQSAPITAGSAAVVAAPAVQTAAVPEPASLGIAAAAAVLASRRRRRN